MSDAHRKFLCEAVAIAGADHRLLITVHRFGDGIEFSSDEGGTKYGSPRYSWTNDNIRREIALVYGAKSVELVHPVQDLGKRG
jgi:hypothetical protein